MEKWPRIHKSIRWVSWPSTSNDQLIYIKYYPPIILFIKSNDIFNNIYSRLLSNGILSRECSGQLSQGICPPLCCQVRLLAYPYC